MKYELTTETKESYWVTAYYKVEANSLSEAIKKVKNDEVIPYDSYSEYSGEVIPEYSPKKYIYEGGTNLIWTEKIPYHENWTRSLRLTKHSVKQLLKTNFTVITGKLSWAAFKEIADELRWTVNEHFEFKDKQLPYWANIITPDGDKYGVHGYVWTDQFSIEKLN